VGGIARLPKDEHVLVEPLGADEENDRGDE
jgi:hypothetical protein